MPCSETSRPICSSSEWVRIPIVTLNRNRTRNDSGERERADRGEADHLRPELVEAAAVEEAALPRLEVLRERGDGEEAERERAPDTGHAVRGHRADRVVDSDPLDEERPEHDDDARDEADHDRRPRRHEGARRGDRDERRDRPVQHHREVGLLDDDPRRDARRRARPPPQRGSSSARRRRRSRCRRSRPTASSRG